MAINFQSYSDDAQLYITASLDETSPNDTIHECILDIDAWLAQDFLQLNQDKTRAVVIGAEVQRERLTFKLKSLALSPRQQAINLDIIIEI